MNTTINLRLQADLKNSLQELAEEYGSSLSDYLREILNNHLDNFTYGPLQRECDNVLDDENEIAILPFERTYEFSVLTAWLFQKRTHPNDVSSTEVLNSLKEDVQKAIHQSSFSEQLQMEFQKVETDMTRFLTEPNQPYKQFRFPLPNNYFSFNYNLLLNELWSLKPLAL